MVNVFLLVRLIHLFKIFCSWSWLMTYDDYDHKALKNKTKQREATVKKKADYISRLYLMAL